MSTADSDSGSESDEGIQSEQKNLTGEPVEIVVGSEKTSYFSHEGLLRQASKFFDTALKKEWEEGQKRSISLPEDDPDAVYAYLQWLYGRKLIVKTKNGNGEPMFDPLARLYVLGEKLLDNDLQDRVLDKLIAPIFGTPPTWPHNKCINIIYEGTPPSSPARRLLVDSWVKSGIGRWVDRTSEGRWKVPDDFKTDLI